MSDMQRENLRMAPTPSLERRMVAQCDSGTGERFLLGRRYTLDKNLGEDEGQGADGTVWFATDTQTGHLVFVKMFKAGTDEDDIKQMRCQREWAMVKRIQETRLAPKAAPLSHPIVALLESSYGTVSQGRTEEGALFYQVMERCDHDLFTPLARKHPRQGYKFSEPLARFLFRQIVNGVKLMADAGIHHRDLKMENILLKNVPPRG